MDNQLIAENNQLQVKKKRTKTYYVGLLLVNHHLFTYSFVYFSLKGYETKQRWNSRTD